MSGSSDDKAQVLTRLDEFCRLYSGNKIDELWKSLYKEGASFMPPGAATCTGTEAIEHLKAMKAQGMDKLEHTQSETIIRGDIAVGRGNHKFYTKEGTLANNGKDVLVWEKIGGTWYIVMDIFNTSP